MRKAIWSFGMLIVLILQASCKTAKERDVDGINSKKTDSISVEQFLREKAEYCYMNSFFDEGIKYYDELILIDSNKSGYYFKRGYCKMRVLDDAGAVWDFQKSIYMDYSKKDFAYFYIGLIHRKKAIFYASDKATRISEYNTALYYYNKAIEIAPDNYEAIQEKKEVNLILQDLR